MKKQLIELFELVLDINKDEMSGIKVHMNQNENEILIMIHCKFKNGIIKTFTIPDLKNKSKKQQNKLKSVFKYLVFKSI